ncbi:hypothetical protein BDP27DRAFT_1230366 [Rhodocollybia butyracea]|uniref:Uncharacterized protein n=1 Tax=Rhodocollybia butyracea TaxID=206335 RepID=A0A9P5PIN0_9AGAR|nr:hypothetical protein BDP27DRAFT_1230366 [Rhodocollybia butyracea]
MIRPHNFLLFIACVGDQLSLASQLVNRTIDDTYGDSSTGLMVQYTPSSNSLGGPYWVNNEQCNTTAGSCAITPSTNFAFDHTWTQTTYFPNVHNISVGFSFSGIAIYVYLIVTNAPLNSSLVSNVFCDFRLDGEIVGHFSHLTDNSSNPQFNVSAFNKIDLNPGNHEMLIETTGDQNSFIIFDYALYT